MELQNNRTMKKRLLQILIGACIVGQANAQFYVDEATVHNDGAILYVGPNATNDNGTIDNLGNTHFRGNYVNIGLSPILRNRTAVDTIFSGGDFDVAIGAYEGSFSQNGYTGALVFDGTIAQTVTGKAASNDNFYNVVIDNTLGSANDVTLIGQITVENSLRFNNGTFSVASPNTFTMFTNTSVLGTPGATSHVNGMLNREGHGGVSDLFFPIGNGTEYRPAWAKDLAVTAPLTIISFETVDGPTGGAEGMGVEQLIDTRYWRGVYSAEYVPGRVELSYGAPEGVTNMAELVVAQSTAVNGTYKGLDQSATTGALANGTVISDFNASQEYLMIGESANMRVDLNAYLEGAYNGALAMHDSLYTGGYGDLLGPHYEAGNAGANNYGIDMVETYSVPSTGAQPVDVVMLTIRDGAAPTVDLDTTYAWLMSDGTIRDFSSGTQGFATFTDLALVPSNNYTVAVWHRNHVPLMFSNGSGSAPYGLSVGQDPSSPVLFDVTDPSFIYSTGYKPLAGGVAGLYIGNAEQTVTPLEVNALDLWIVGNDAVNNMPNNDIIDTDVTLSGETNATDWDKTKWANDQLYYSTIP